jgi:hypothetical protein
LYLYNSETGEKIPFDGRILWPWPEGASISAEQIEMLLRRQPGAEPARRVLSQEVIEDLVAAYALWRLNPSYHTGATPREEEMISPREYLRNIARYKNWLIIQ